MSKGPMISPLNQLYYQRPLSPKNRSGLQNQSFTVSPKQPGSPYNSEVNSIQKENSFLKEENESLKKELEDLKKEFGSKKTTLFTDLRDTVKQESGYTKQLKNRAEIMARQCRIYEEIIAKMEVKIKRVNTENRRLIDLLEENNKNHQPVHFLQQKLREVMTKYAELENRVREEEDDWLKFQEQWSREKNYYLAHIKQLEQRLQENLVIRTKSKSFIPIKKSVIQKPSIQKTEKIERPSFI